MSIDYLGEFKIKHNKDDKIGFHYNDDFYDLNKFIQVSGEFCDAFITISDSAGLAIKLSDCCDNVKLWSVY